VADDGPVGSTAHDRSTVGSSPDHIGRIVDAVGHAGDVGRRGIVCRCACRQTGGSRRKHDSKAESKSGREHAVFLRVIRPHLLLVSPAHLSAG
jgi:hypothetical protein